MTTDDLKKIRMWDPVVTPDGPGMAQSIILTKDGEQHLQVSIHQVDERTKKKVVIWKDYPLEQVAITPSPTDLRCRNVLVPAA